MQKSKFFLMLFSVCVLAISLTGCSQKGPDILENPLILASKDFDPDNFTVGGVTFGDTKDQIPTKYAISLLTMSGTLKYGLRKNNIIVFTNISDDESNETITEFTLYIPGKLLNIYRPSDIPKVFGKPTSTSQYFDGYVYSNKHLWVSFSPSIDLLDLKDVVVISIEKFWSISVK